tara:strand:+ start:44442 stop:45341 length:900 start_codon:yes stop_codon:yes gene_type:complete
MSEAIAYINDQYVPASEAKVSILEPTFTKSDVVYDTISATDRSIFRLEDHLDRFENSCKVMQITPPYTRSEISTIVANCIDRTGLDDTCTTIMGTRGPYKDISSRDPRNCSNGLIVLSVPYYYVIPKERAKNGINLSIVENKRVPAESVDARVKNFNWMDLTRGLLESYDKGGDSALLCTPDGKLSEGPGFNVWLAKNGTLKTPKGNLLEGITRRTVFELAAEIGIKTIETDIYPDELREADEAFTTTTAGALASVVEIDSKPLGNGAPGLLTSQLSELYWKKRKDGWYGTHVDDLLEQ